MIPPETWFTLYTLAKLGGIHRPVTLTTRELGEILGISQQTASRRISDVVDMGYVNRSHTASGMLVQLSETGKTALSQVRKELEIAFIPPDDEVVIKGVLVQGIGEGAYYVDAYADRFQKALGFKPFSGTLNVKIVNEESRVAVSKMKHSPPLIVSGFTDEGRTFGDVICYRTRVNGELEGAVVIAQRTHHSPNILEVISPHNIRKKLKVGNGDEIRLTLIPLHLAT
jgi:riboflavin kinase